MYVCVYVCMYVCMCVCVCIITEDAYRKHINEKNPLGMGGNLAKAYGSLLHEMWSGNTSYTHPRNLKVQHMLPQSTLLQQAYCVL